MDISNSNIRCCILIRGTRSSTTNEMINSYCEKYGQINYSRIALSPQGIMRGYNVVFKQEQSVNRFMDTRPHHIDGQSVKVKRCIPANEEWRLTSEILITTSDSSTDKQIFQEQTLRDYFSRYGTIRVCRLDTYHNRPCAYLTFTDYDRVDQLINDKPHTINKIMINIHKHIPTDKKTWHSSSKQSSNPPTKRRQGSAIEGEHPPPKQPRRMSPKRMVSEKSNLNSEDNEIIRLKDANDLLIREVQSLISTPSQSIPTTTSNEIFRIQNEYERANLQMLHYRNEQNDKSIDNHKTELLNKLENDVENLLKEIRNMQQKPKKTFADELFDKYTIEYILSLNVNDVQQRLEQLEKENQLLLLIKQNMPNETVPKTEQL